MAPEVVATGPPFLVVPSADRVCCGASVPAALPGPEPYRGCPNRAMYCFTLGGDDPATSARCRMFAPLDGIAEDPATGSAAGPLGAYLARYAHPGETACRFLFEQGHEMGRPSRMEVEIERQIGPEGEHFTAIRVGGPAVIVARGVMAVP